MSVIEIERTARKPRQCARCNRTIQAGERYIRHAMTPNDSEFGNPRWWILATHVNQQCYLATESQL